MQVHSCSPQALEIPTGIPGGHDAETDAERTSQDEAGSTKELNGNSRKGIERIGENERNSMDE